MEFRLTPQELDAAHMMHLRNLFPHVEEEEFNQCINSYTNVRDMIAELRELDDEQELSRICLDLCAIFPEEILDSDNFSKMISSVPNHISKKCVALDFILGRPLCYQKFNIKLTNVPTMIKRKQPHFTIKHDTKIPKLQHLDKPSTSAGTSHRVVKDIEFLEFQRSKKEGTSSKNDSEMSLYDDDDDNTQLPTPIVEFVEKDDAKTGEIVNGPSTSKTILKVGDGNVDPINSHINPLDKRRKKILSHLKSIFLDAQPEYIEQLVSDHECSIDEFVDIMLEGYPKREKQSEAQKMDEKIDYDAQIEVLKNLLPDADPNYLENYLHRCSIMADLTAFINEAVERRNYPKLEDAQKKEKLNAQIRQYTSEFNIDNFLEIIPDPETYFTDGVFTSQNLITSNYEHALNFFKNAFPSIAIRDISRVVSKAGNFFEIVETLKVHEKKIKKPRTPIASPNSCTCIPLLQLISYYKHKKEILEKIAQNKELAEERRRIAGEQNKLITCSCCYDDAVLPEESVKCPNGCEFCKSCVQKQAEIKFTENQLDFQCLLNCGSSFSLAILQSAISAKLFSKIARRKQMEEVKAAGIENLEMCPFCDFATIPSPEDRLFKCLNPECMKEHCRLCKEPSHVPLRCEEVEKDVDVKRRTYIENEMTEALLRKCWKCGIKFIKSDGCNKMTCSCGALMCYLCKSPVTDYKHFYGQGSYDKTKCPLYSNTELLHEQSAVESGMKAKEKLGNVELKVDPLFDAEKRLKKAAKTKNPVPM